MKTSREGMPAARRVLVRLWATACAATIGACQGTPQAGPLGQVAWVSGDSLWAQALPVGKPRLLGVAAELTRPVYSPSGRWLAVRARDGLRLVRTDGAGGERLATAEAADYAWAPTDDRVAYVAGGNLLVTRAGGIGTVLVDRTGAPAVTSVAWSADGQWLAFALEKPSALSERKQAGAPTGAPVSEVWRMPARGGAPSPVAGRPPAGALRPQGWTTDGVPTADGRHRLVVRPGHGGTASLRLVAGSDAEERVVARLDRRQPTLRDQANGPAPWADLVAYSPR